MVSRRVGLPMTPEPRGSSEPSKTHLPSGIAAVAKGGESRIQRKMRAQRLTASIEPSWPTFVAPPHGICDQGQPQIPRCTSKVPSGKHQVVLYPPTSATNAMLHCSHVPRPLSNTYSRQTFVHDRSSACYDSDVQLQNDAVSERTDAFQRCARRLPPQFGMGGRPAETPSPSIHLPWPQCP